jgi:hypothetical protein
MNTINRIIFQLIVLSVLLNWFVLYRLSKQEPQFSWWTALLAIPVILLTGAGAFYLDKNHVNLIKMKFNDRGLYVDDFIKMAGKIGFLPTTVMGDHYFFSRTSYFPPKTEIIDLKFFEDGECLVTCPTSIANNLKKALQAYVILREREFLKETDRMMEKE